LFDVIIEGKNKRRFLPSKGYQKIKDEKNSIV